MTDPIKVTAAHLVRAEPFANGLEVSTYDDGTLVIRVAGAVLPFPRPERRRLAAMALEGLTSAFTHEDVAMVRAGAVACEDCRDDDARDALLSLASRIAALLPPETR